MAVVIKNETQLSQQAEMLQEVLNVLDEMNIKNWLHSGTVLGIYREDDFIKWDTDTEIAVHYEDIKPVENEVVKRLKQKDYKIKHRPEKDHYGIVGLKKGYKIEIDGWKNEEGQNYVNYSRKKSRRYVVPKPFFDVLTIKILRGVAVKIPEDTERYLEWVYGDWQTPKQSSNNRKYLAKTYRRKWK